MNRLKQQRVTQTTGSDAVTKWTYTLAGLVETMQDPKHFADGSAENYLYQYDLMGRRTAMRYPAPIENGARNWEYWEYDHPGRLWLFTNRRDNVQTFSYDARHRCTGFSWNDGGVTPSVTFGYDAASRLIGADNANAAIDFAYFNDNLLQSETEQITGSAYLGTPVSYTYDANGNRASDAYPDGRGNRTYTYTNRNQLKTITETALLATYTYDVNGNLSSRVPWNGTRSDYTYDELDRATRIVHTLTDTTRSFDYQYDNVGNRNWVERDDANTGDVFDYDLADQVTVAKLDITNPAGTSPGSPTIAYDANGNRISFAPYGWTDTYATNLLNQYTSRDGINASYDNNGNMTTALDTSAYAFDAQNRVISAAKNGTTVTFKYDALNRVVTRYVNGARYDNMWDGWNLILTINSSNGWTNAYWPGPGGMLAEWASGTSTKVFYSDASGSTTHIADSTTGALLEWYRYDLDGTPIVYDPNGNVRTGGSIFNVRHLFTGQQWYSDLGLYDLRNRFYSPDIGRFLQPDPIHFRGDRTNLYRYCRNNPVTWRDPLGLQELGIGDTPSEKGSEATYPGVVVPGAPIGDGSSGDGGGSIADRFQWDLIQSIFGEPGTGLVPRELGLGPLREAREGDEEPNQNQNPNSVDKAPPNPSLVNPQSKPSLAQGAVTTAELARAATATAMGAVVFVSEYEAIQDAAADLGLGQTIYIKDPLSYFLSGLTGENVFLQIQKDANGRTQLAYVYPGGA